MEQGTYYYISTLGICQPFRGQAEVLEGSVKKDQGSYVIQVPGKKMNSLSTLEVSLQTSVVTETPSSPLWEI